MNSYISASDVKLGDVCVWGNHYGSKAFMKVVGFTRSGYPKFMEMRYKVIKHEEGVQNLEVPDMERPLLDKIYTSRPYKPRQRSFRPYSEEELASMSKHILLRGFRITKWNGQPMVQYLRDD